VTLPLTATTACVFACSPRTVTDAAGYGVWSK
jgi:hypothetical protein